ncbi:hypothetical protein Tco_0549069 [Tanacetum coccineum]
MTNNSNVGIPPRQSSCQKSTSGELDLIFHRAVAYAEYSLHPFKPLVIPGSVVVPPGSVVVPPGSVVVPPGSVVVTPGSVVVTPGSVVVTTGSVVVTPGSVVVTTGSVVVTTGSVVVTTGSVVNIKVIDDLMVYDDDDQCNLNPCLDKNPKLITLENLDLFQNPKLGLSSLNLVNGYPNLQYFLEYLKYDVYSVSLHARLRLSPTSDMKEILLQRMLEENYDKGHANHRVAYEALQDSIHHDKVEDFDVDKAQEESKKKSKQDSPNTPPGSPPSPPPPPPPPLGASGASSTTGASDSAQAPPPPPPSSSTH